VLVMNKKKWDEIPADLQKLLIEAEDEAARFAKQRALDLIKNEKDALEKMGVQYVQLPPDEAKKLVDAAYSALWDIILEKSPTNGPKLKEMVSK
jgi:TRAP-type C4-dicarboxylate transport system substrate-binding protein